MQEQEIRERLDELFKELAPRAAEPGDVAPGDGGGGTRGGDRESGRGGETDGGAAVEDSRGGGDTQRGRGTSVNLIGGFGGSADADRSGAPLPCMAKGWNVVLHTEEEMANVPELPALVADGNGGIVLPDDVAGQSEIAAATSSLGATSRPLGAGRDAGGQAAAPT